MPPAFVLSQDQTLYDSCISIILSNELKSILFNNACVITFVFFSLVLTFLLISSKEFQGSLLFFLHCLVFKMLFLFRLPAKQLYYYITAFLICQVLFSSFFKLFFQLLVTALLSCNFYIISHCLNFVKCFFKLFFKSSLSSRSSFQALLNVFPCVQIFLAYSRSPSTPVPDSFIIIS